MDELGPRDTQPHPCGMKDQQRFIEDTEQIEAKLTIGLIARLHQGIVPDRAYRTLDGETRMIHHLKETFHIKTGSVSWFRCTDKYQRSATSFSLIPKVVLTPTRASLTSHVPSLVPMGFGLQHMLERSHHESHVTCETMS